MTTKQATSSTARTAGIALVTLGILFLVSQFIPWFGTLIWAVFLLGGGALLYGIYKNNDEQWWLLIPAYALALSGGLVALGAFGLHSLIAPALLTGFAAPFVYLYMLNREHWFWLLPAGAFLVPAAITLTGAIWPILPTLLIVGGVYLLMRNLDGDSTPVADARPIEAPKTGPEADHA